MLITNLRELCKVKSINKMHLSYVPIISPITVYILLTIASSIGICYPVVADWASFCFMIGVLVRLSKKNSGAETIRLRVHLIDSDNEKEVWLKNSDVTLLEVRNMIADAYHVHPASRVSIESGKGKFLDKPDAALVPLISNDFANKDLFGFSTVHCYIAILDEFNPLTQEEIQHKKAHTLSSMIPTIMDHRGAIRYGLDITLSGKIPNAANDAKAFEVRSVDMYAAAAPAKMPDTVHFVGWRESSDGEADNSRTKFESQLSGQKLQDGDCIVIENHGKFMSVVRGWWIAWSSSVPRRSGAFRVEIIEKASLNTLEKGLESIKGKIRHKERDTEGVLRAGDVFRLRSVKFPGFELGVTGVRLTDDFFHLGLRKIDDDSPNWCLPLQFTAKIRKETLLKMEGIL